LLGSVARFSPGPHVLFTKRALNLTSSPRRSHTSLSTYELRLRSSVKSLVFGLFITILAFSSLGLALLLSLGVLSLNLLELFSFDTIFFSFFVSFSGLLELSSLVLLGLSLLVSLVNLLLLELEFTIGLGL
jgi:hypothetical protein